MESCWNDKNNKSRTSRDLWLCRNQLKNCADQHLPYTWCFFSSSLAIFNTAPTILIGIPKINQRLKHTLRCYPGKKTKWKFIKNWVFQIRKQKGLYFTKNGFTYITKRVHTIKLQASRSYSKLHLANDNPHSLPN